MDPRVAGSARKHGLEVADIVHAYWNPTRVFLLDDIEMLIGPDRVGRLIEVGVVRAEEADVVIHAMPARPKFMR